MIGTSMVAASASVMNQWFERDRDFLMPRTRNRPLPSGRLTMSEANVFGWLLFVFGLSLTYFGANMTAALVSFCDMVYLLLGLYADEGLVVVEHGRWNIARCFASDDRLDCCRRIDWLDGRLGTYGDRDPLAVPTLYGDRLAVQGSVLPGRLSNAHSRGAFGNRCRLACGCSFDPALPTVGVCLRP